MVTFFVLISLLVSAFFSSSVGGFQFSGFSKLHRPSSTLTMLNNNKGALNFPFFTNNKKNSPSNNNKPKYPTIVVNKNYNVALGCLGLAGAAFVTNNTPLAAGLGVLGGFLFLQTGKIRFVFDDEAMEVCVLKSDSDAEQLLTKTRENFAVGGRNRWTYDSFKEWSFIPTKDFPVFMYYREVQTNPADPKGQFHLFPVIMNGKELYDVLMERVGAVPRAIPPKQQK